MKTSDFYYDLPQALIAQTPVEPRDSSRMLSLDRKSGSIAHLHFYDIPDKLQAGDCLILNDSRVLPARIYGIKNNTGAKVEFLLCSKNTKTYGNALQARESVQRQERALSLATG